MKRFSFQPKGAALAVAVLAAAAPAAAIGGQEITRPAPEQLTSNQTFFADDELTLGSPLAPITVVEYLSTTCSHCAAFERDTWPKVEEEFVASGKVRFVVREMPTAPVAVSAAGFLIARCSGVQRYWSVIRSLLENQSDVLSAPDVMSAIRSEEEIAKLDPDDARACLSDPVAIDAINTRRQAGLDAGVDSTPYFLINGYPLRPGTRLSGRTYEGGELSFKDFSDLMRNVEIARPKTPASSQPGPAKPEAPTRSVEHLQSAPQTRHHQSLTAPRATNGSVGEIMGR